MRSVRRCFQLMEMFDEDRRSMTASDIARRIDAPLSSVMDLLRCLQELGYISFDSRDRSYFMTTRLAMLGNWMAESQVNEKSYRAIINELHEKTRETVCVFWQNNLQMKCVATIRGTHPLSFDLPVGNTVPIVGSAVGTILLAQWSDSEVSKLLKKAAARDDTDIDEKPLLRKVRKARKDGYCAVYDDLLPEVGAIAVAAPVIANQWLVFSIGGLSKRIKQDEKNIVDLLKEVTLENPLSVT